jgi:hypothetical protein
MKAKGKVTRDPSGVDRSADTPAREEPGPEIDFGWLVGLLQELIARSWVLKTLSGFFCLRDEAFNGSDVWTPRRLQRISRVGHVTFALAFL